MQDVTQRQCKVVSDSRWSLSTFMEFYERILSPRIFQPYGRLLAGEIASDIDAGFAVKDVLEVACGTGVITASLYEDLARPRGLRLVASDLSQIAVDMARRVLNPEIQQNVPLLADVDMAELPFDDNSFDVIVCGFGLMFPPDKARVAREFRRVLRPGGRVYATMFHYNQLFELTRQQSQLHFGMPSRLMDAALSLTDPSPITRAFAIEGLSRANDVPAGLHPLSFSLDAAGAREFLFNACILLEEFNQCDTRTREHYLDLMLAQFGKDVPDQCYRVEAWLLRGQADPANAGTTVDIASPDFSPLVRCQQLTHRASSAGVECAISVQEAQGLAAFTAAKAEFLAEYPGFPDASVEKMRNEEYARLDEQHVTYLDHVGGTLPPESLLEQDLQALKHAILGNPHSGSKASQAAYQEARDAIYAFFDCSPDEYEVIFTANASSAIRLVAESFPFQPCTQLLLTKDNHTSVHGLREYARAKGASVKYIPLDDDLLLHDDLMRRALQRLGDGAPHLLAFPAQSNATGARHDLAW
ncbi:aminotransferase class V-fold PLP-dependent enzyme, partial [Stenotrophomonas geniculata]